MLNGHCRPGPAFVSAAFAALLLVAARRLPALEVERPTAEITTRADSSGLFETRLVARLPTAHGELRVGALEVGAGLVPERIAPLVASSFLLVGPLRVFGLLSELDAPISRSAAYLERTRLAIDTSFDGGSRDGVVISPLPDALDLFVLRERDGSTRVGLLARASAPGFLDGTLLVTECPAPPTRAPQAWFTDGEPAPLPDLLHGAALGRVSLGPVALTAGGALSLTQVERPGAYGRLTLDARAGPLSGTLTGAALSPSFLLPDASRPDERASLGAELALKLPRIELGGAYEFCLGALSPVPARARPSEHGARARLRIGSGDARLAADVARTLSFSETGAPSLDGSSELSASLRLGPLRAELYSARSASNREATKHTVGAALVAAGALSRGSSATAAGGIDLSWKSAACGGGTLCATVDLNAPVAGGLITLEARLAQAAPAAAPRAAPELLISLGWKVSERTR